MKKVYFKKVDVLDNNINVIIYDMLKNLVEKESVVLNEVVPLKVHFGEKGNETYIKSEYMDGIKKYLKDNNKETCYIETNVLYKGARTKTEDHINVAKEHGFTDLDIIIADGDTDNAYEEVTVNLKNFDKCKIGYKFKDYNNYIVVSHFKGHGMAGFGGAIKQLAMGFASRGGKLHQHSDSVPVLDKEKCIACSKCINKCPVNAISIVDGKAHIDEKICVGCASCTPVCPVDSITNSWKVSNFHEKIAEYAYAAALGKTNIYVQYAFNITKDCDCIGSKMDPIAPNIGVFVSTDPVAIDKATYDYFNNVCPNHNFDSANITLNYANEIGLGSLEYILEEI